MVCVIHYVCIVDSVYFSLPSQLVFHILAEVNCTSREKALCTAVSNLSHLEPITKDQYID